MTAVSRDGTPLSHSPPDREAPAGLAYRPTSPSARHTLD